MCKGVFTVREVIKRDGTHVAFDESKIYQAILKAMKYGSGVIDKEIAKKIAHEINLTFEHLQTTPTIFQIETYVYLKLIENGHELTAKAYEGYRAIQQFKRETNTTDDSILSLIDLSNEEVMNESREKCQRILRDVRSCRHVSCRLMMRESYTFMIWIISCNLTSTAA